MAGEAVAAEAVPQFPVRLDLFQVALGALVALHLKLKLVELHVDSGIEQVGKVRCAGDLPPKFPQSLFGCLQVDLQIEVHGALSGKAVVQGDLVEQRDRQPLLGWAGADSGPHAPLPGAAPVPEPHPLSRPQNGQLPLGGGLAIGVLVLVLPPGFDLPIDVRLKR